MIRTLYVVMIALILVSCGTSPPENPVIGVIVAIEGDRMELEWGNAENTEFRIADQTVAREHLVDHMRMRWAVKVTFEEEGDSLRAVMIEDATPTPAGTSPPGEPQGY